MNIMNMKLSVLILPLLLCCSLNAQNGTPNLSRWHLDEKIETSDYQLIRKAKLYFFLSNDNDNIYINIMIENQEVQHKILNEGLTIWINMDGKAVKQMGVRFPIGSQNPGARNKADRLETNAIPDASNSNSLSMANTIELIGFINEEERRFPAENADNFRGSVKYDEAGILYYKMVLPIAKLPVRNSKNGYGAMAFTLGIEYGSIPALSKPGVNRGPAPSSGLRSGASRSGASELNWINNVKLASSK